MVSSFLAMNPWAPPDKTAGLPKSMLPPAPPARTEGGTGAGGDGGRRRNLYAERWEYVVALDEAAKQQRRQGELQRLLASGRAQGLDLTLVDSTGGSVLELDVWRDDGTAKGAGKSKSPALDKLRGKLAQLFFVRR